jgi:hypothetical protein
MLKKILLISSMVFLLFSTCETNTTYENHQIEEVSEEIDVIKIYNEEKMLKETLGDCEYEARRLSFCPYTSCFCKNSDGEWRHYFDEFTLCLDTKEFKSYGDVYDVPFVGKVGEKVKEIYVDGMKMTINDRNDLFFRKKIRLVGGYNRISVKTVAELGCSKEFYLTININ